MKRFAAVVLTAATLFLGTGAARALDPVEDEYQDSITHPCGSRGTSLTSAASPQSG